jgi:hypothetical protein
MLLLMVESFLGCCVGLKSCLAAISWCLRLREEAWYAGGNFESIMAVRVVLDRVD